MLSLRRNPLNFIIMKTKIIIMIPCWKRAGVLKIVSEQLELFFEANSDKYLITVLFVFSQEDPELDALVKIYNNATYRRDNVFFGNWKLGRKHNAGIRKANEIGYDYIMNMGSDDLIHPDIMKLYAPLIADKVAVFGITKLYFHDIVEDKTVHFSYYNNPNVVGAGRMISRAAMAEVKNKFGSLYDFEIKRRLDGQSAQRLLQCGFKQIGVDPGDFPYIVDIKCGENINGFDRIVESENRNGISKVNNEVVKSVYKMLK